MLDVIVSTRNFHGARCRIYFNCFLVAEILLTKQWGNWFENGRACKDLLSLRYKLCYHTQREFDLTEDLDSVTTAWSSFMWSWKLYEIYFVALLVSTVTVEKIVTYICCEPLHKHSYFDRNFISTQVCMQLCKTCE